MERRILKPIDELRVRDLSDHPVWRFALDAEGVPGQNETSVEPVAHPALPREHPDPLFVAADFFGADGGSYVGLVQVTSDGDLTLEPCALVTAQAYAPLPEGWMADSVKRFAEEVLGVPLDPLYPLTFTLRVRVEGEAEFRFGRVVKSWTQA